MSIVIGTIIGTGIFLKTAIIAQNVGTPFLVIAAWIAAGLLSLAGALTYAELGAMLPEAGGEYVYLRSAYGDIPAFLLGWELFIVEVGSPAALGVAFATFLSVLLPIGGIWIERSFLLFGRDILWQFGMREVLAVAAILSCAAINCMRVAFSGNIQKIFTIAKVLGIAVIVAGIFFFSKDASWENLAAAEAAPQWSGMKAFGAAMVAALWGYHGWALLTTVAGEIKNPGRNIPRAMIGGMLIVIVVYSLVNLAYFYALPFGEIVTSNSTLYPDALPVAGKAVLTFLGPLGIGLISVLFVISAFGTLHSDLLGLPRIFFAMARDGIFFSRFGSLSKGTHVPAFSIIVRAILACVLAIAGTFDQLTTLVVFALWIFYVLTTVSVFILRRKMPDIPRPYRTFGYPVVPLLFIIVTVWLFINTLLTNPVESAFGLLLILLGLPFYFFFRHGSRQETGAVKEEL